MKFSKHLGHALATGRARYDSRRLRKIRSRSLSAEWAKSIAHATRSSAVAVKVLPNSFAGTPRRMHRFSRECSHSDSTSLCYGMLAWATSEYPLSVPAESTAVVIGSVLTRLIIALVPFATFAQDIRKFDPELDQLVESDAKLERIAAGFNK
jgi:hypothetical protein